VPPFPLLRCIFLFPLLGPCLCPLKDLTGYQAFPLRTGRVALEMISSSAPFLRQCRPPVPLFSLELGGPFPFEAGARTSLLSIALPSLWERYLPFPHHPQALPTLVFPREIFFFLATSEESHSLGHVKWTASFFQDDNSSAAYSIHFFLRRHPLGG